MNQISTLVTALLAAPCAAVVLCALMRQPRVAEFVNLAAAVVSFACVVWLLPKSLGGPFTFWGNYFIVDPLGAWALLCVATVYLLGSVYAIGYMRSAKDESHLHRFYALYAAFALTTLSGPLMNNVGVYWIAIELTTLVSTFLVCFELGHDSIEAAWKYIVVVSAGISLALLGTVFYYWGGSVTLGPTYDMTWSALRDVAPNMNPSVAVTAFLLVTIGFGTKVGLAPMHTWLPDAHSEGPTPVSVMLSGALLNTAMIGIVRYIQVSDAAHLGLLPRTVVVSLGAFSLFIAALFIVRQTGIKRLMAYSSVEHMGVLALGFGFGGPLGVAGALYHMLGHSLNKSLMFFGAGNAMHVFGTKNMDDIRHAGARMPATGWLWLAGAVAITGAPPFALFLSELTILRAGLTGSNAWAVFVMALLLIVIFVGFLNHFRQMFFSEPQALPAESGGRNGGSGKETRMAHLPIWCTLPMWICVIALVVLGVWWPDFFGRFFAAVSDSLTSGGRP